MLFNNICIRFKDFRHVENLFIQGFLSVQPKFVFIVQPISEPVQKKTLDE